MRLYLDTSVLLAACGSTKGASREIFRLAPANSWALIVTPYVLEEVVRNLPQLPLSASMDWPRLRHDLQVKDDVLTLALPAVFPVTKDRPVLFSALAWADALLTLDRADFAQLLGGAFYGLPILRPGAFLEAEHAAGQLKRT
jgi:predicted nucleic acid-binding protein